MFRPLPILPNLIRRSRQDRCGTTARVHAGQHAWRYLIAFALLAACSNGNAPVSNLLKFPPVDLEPAGLPSYAIGDRFTFDNPEETWIVIAIADGLVTWRSSLGAERKTVFDPFVAPVAWSDKAGDAGTERLVTWRNSLFPLAGGKKSAHQSVRRPEGEVPAPVEWKCYSGNPRNVTTKAGTFPAYPVLCRRSDGLTVQSFYAPAVNAPLLITVRMRPAPAKTRELIGFTLAADGRVAAKSEVGLPMGWAQAAVATPHDLEQRPTTVAQRGAAAASAPEQAPVRNGQKTPSGSGAAPSIAARTPATSAPATPGEPIQPPQSKPSATPATRTAPNITSPNLETSTIAPPQIAIPTIAMPTTVMPKVAIGVPTRFGVQIASYQQAKNIGPGWLRFRGKLRPLLDDIKHTVERADLGGGKGVYHRLIAGRFAARADADAFCQSIRKHGVDCLVRSIASSS
jgi:hypothetical protein